MIYKDVYVMYIIQKEEIMSEVIVISIKSNIDNLSLLGKI